MKKEELKCSNQLELLLDHLLDDKAVQLHKVEAQSIVTFSHEDKEKKSVIIPLKGIFSDKNFQGLSISEETLNQYASKFKTSSIQFNNNHEFKHEAHVYAAYHYSKCGKQINYMIRNNEFELDDDTSITSKFKNSTIDNINATIILSHGLIRHKSQKPYESFRIMEWNKSFFPLGYCPNISYYLQESAFLSFSGESGAVALYNLNRQYTFIYNGKNFGMDISLISKYPHEKEILLPPGVEISYRVINKIENFTFLEATFVSSSSDQKESEHLTKIPQIKRPSDAIQNYFLQYLYDNIFSKPFADAKEWNQDAELKRNQIVVYKPNHGILHTLRKMERVIFCILFFAEHSNNKDLSELCRQLSSEDEITVLEEKVKVQQLIDEIALLTGSTSIGRESEYSFSDNKEKYAQYRKQSLERFLEFLKSEKVAKELGFVISAKRLKVYEDVLIHFGEPDYMREMTGFHLCIMHLINTPQVLDMRRCFDTELSMIILTERLSPVIKPKSIKYLESLMHFGVSWLQLTGDRIIQKDKMVSKKGYDLYFLEYSTSQIFRCKNLLRQSPGIFFSRCVSVETEPTKDVETEPTKKDKDKDKDLMFKMVAYLSAAWIFHKNKKQFTQDGLLSSLVILIKEMAKLQLAMGLCEQFLEILIKKKISRESLPEKDKYEALIAALNESSIPSGVVRCLLEEKVSPNYRNEKDETPLMLAAKNENVDMQKVQLLVDYNADPTLRSRSNWSAFDYASFNMNRYESLFFENSSGQPALVTPLS